MGSSAPDGPTPEEVQAELDERVAVDATLEGRIARAVHLDAMLHAGVKPAVAEGRWADLHRDLRAPWLRAAAAALGVILEDS